MADKQPINKQSSKTAQGFPFAEIEDNGPGIPAEERDRVFDRFYRAAGTPGQGAGLGLAIVKEVAERHAARNELSDPKEGTGTRFRIVFDPV